MCIHPCCCVLLLCNFHHLCNAPGDKNAAKQAAHLISCNWLPFYRPCSFASQTFVCFADFLIIAFKILQKTYFIILHCSTLHKKNLTALTLKNKKKNSRYIYSNCSPSSEVHAALTLLFPTHLYSDRSISLELLFALLSASPN